MKRTRSRLKAIIIYIVTVVQLATMAAPFSVAVFAQEAPPAEPVACVAPANMRQPTGSSAHMFTWNCDSNLWENAYYTWNTTNGVITPKFAPEHRFDEASNMWQVWQWQYVPPANAYQLQLVSTYAPAAPTPPTPPVGGATIENTGPDSTNTITDANGTIQNTGPNSSNTIVNIDGSILNTGPSSSNALSLTDNNQTNMGVAVDIDVTNNLNSAAVSGNASVLQNTTAGNALSGDATAVANILNMLQSTWGLNGFTPDIYTANIQGDYFGDIMINPNMLGIGNGGCSCGDLTVNAAVDASITNNVDLLAQSGDATVSQNTTAGNATSGDATALANIINMINSSITAGQSFLGILNINGNFTGDVLVAQDVIDELIAANVPTAQISLCGGCGNVLADFNTNQNITNNITTTAASGSADVTNNTTAGNATSGNAETSVTVFNITGRNVVGENALLVFVNVLGEWVGFITDAPGATAAAFGGNLTQNDTMSTGGDTKIDADTNMSITNNVDVTAITGDAEVSYNTRGGNATSGNAKASANVSNIMGSNFGLSGWFGMLFINVLGNWFGSFGVDTPYGNTTLPPQPGIGSPTPQQFVTAGTTTSSSSNSNRRSTPNVRVFSAAIEKDEGGNVVLASVTEATPPTSNAQSFGAAGSSMQNAVIGWSLLAIGTAVIIYFFRRRPTL